MSVRLLLSLFLFFVGSSAWAVTGPEQPMIPDGSGTTIHRLTPDDPTSFDRIQINNSLADDNVCLYIHAFIFKTDDDRVPKLVGETTCMPASRAAAKKTNRDMQPKLIPAMGGDSF